MQKMLVINLSFFSNSVFNPLKNKFHNLNNVCFLNLSLKFYTIFQCLSVRYCLCTDRKHCEKRRKCLLPHFLFFPKMFSNGFFLRFIKTWDCLARGYYSSILLAILTLTLLLYQYPLQDLL